jgi:hypothetical protein
MADSNTRVLAVVRLGLSVLAVSAVLAAGPSLGVAQAPLEVAAPVTQEALSDPATPTELEPSADVQTEYRDVVARAITEFDLGHVAEARALFLRAHELWPSARTRRTLGMTAFELRMYPQALVELQGALEDPRRPLPADQRAQVAGLIEQAKGFVGRYRLQIAPADAEFLVDGSRRAATGTLVIGVGVHELTVRVSGSGELRRELIVQGREDEALVLRVDAAKAAEPTPPTPPPPTAAGAAVASPIQSQSVPDGQNHTPAIIAFSVGGLGVIVGTVSGIIALSKKHDKDHTAGYRAADISTAGWITAGVGALAGTLFLVFEPDQHSTDHASRRRPALRPQIGLGSVGLEGSF